MTSLQHHNKQLHPRLIDNFTYQFLSASHVHCKVFETLHTNPYSQKERATKKELQRRTVLTPVQGGILDILYSLFSKPNVDNLIQHVGDMCGK